MKNQENTNRFQQLGFWLDYYVAGKLIGSSEIFEKQNREISGYLGRSTETIKKELITIKGKKIKAGTVVTTEQQIACGKLKNLS